MSDKKVIIIGDGHLRKDLERQKLSTNITFTGWLPQKDLIEFYQRAQCFVYAAEEDFGIAPVEAQAAGLPVIAYGKGGVSETVVPLNGVYTKQQPTGLFFDKQESDSLIEAIKLFESRKHEFNSDDIRKNTLQFSRQNFKERISTYVGQVLGNHCYASKN